MPSADSGSAVSGSARRGSARRGVGADRDRVQQRGRRRPGCGPQRRWRAGRREVDPAGARVEGEGGRRTGALVRRGDVPVGRPPDHRRRAVAHRVPAAQRVRLEPGVLRRSGVGPPRRPAAVLRLVRVAVRLRPRLLHPRLARRPAVAGAPAVPPRVGVIGAPAGRPAPGLVRPRRPGGVRRPVAVGRRRRRPLPDPLGRVRVGGAAVGRPGRGRVLRPGRDCRVRGVRCAAAVGRPGRGRVLRPGRDCRVRGVRCAVAVGRPGRGRVLRPGRDCGSAGGGRWSARSGAGLAPRSGLRDPGRWPLVGQVGGGSCARRCAFTPGRGSGSAV